MNLANRYSDIKPMPYLVSASLSMSILAVLTK